MSTLGEILQEHERELRKGIIAKPGPPVLVEAAAPSGDEDGLTMTGQDPAGGAPRRRWSTQVVKISVVNSATDVERADEVVDLVGRCIESAEVYELRKAENNTSPNICIGRAKRNDIVIAGPAVSSVHAVVEQVGEQLHLLDHQSSNGTRVNGKRLDSANSHVLRSGDALTFGERTFYFLRGHSFLLFLDVYLRSRDVGPHE